MSCQQYGIVRSVPVGLINAVNSFIENGLALHMENDMSTELKDAMIPTEVRELRRALLSLFLEAPAPVVRDVEAKAEAVLKLIEEKDAEIENGKRRFLSKCRELNAMTELEAACCPEDVGFDEYIKTLRAELDQLRSENERLGNRDTRERELVDKCCANTKTTLRAEIQRLTERCGELEVDNNKWQRASGYWKAHAEVDAQRMKSALIAKVREMCDVWSKQEITGQWYSSAANEIAAALEKVELNDE